MTTKFHGFRQKAYAIVAVVVALTTGVSALVPQFAAAGQATTRTVKLSDSTPGATGVSYEVSFKPTVTTSIGGIVVDFCGDSPIVGNSSCTYPAAFDLGATPTVVVNSGIGTAGWATTSSLQGGATNKQVLVLTNTTPQAPTGTSTAIDFTISGINNPSATGTFFARIVTFDTSAHATAGYTTPTSTTRGATTSTLGLLDYGGAAMSTTTQVSITAKVQESLTFCTSLADLSGATNNTCASATTPSLTLGHGGPPAILDSNAVDRGTIYTQMSTNASAGAIVRMKATNACTNAGLSSTGGAVCNIPGINTGTTPAAMTAGIAGFGLYVANSTTTSGVASSTGTITADPSYHNGAHINEVAPDLWYGMDSSTAGDNVTTTYGDSIMACAAPVSQINNHLVFAATASLTTQAGIYTGNEILIATGTF